jgi:hypothetical protein
MITSGYLKALMQAFTLQNIFLNINNQIASINLREI